ncbi:hypothetical protein GGC65_000969 [Sphingopyxis sp. OAS728]|nr:hypothetical protein [Sphingopyxis sp. OAS728]
MIFALPITALGAASVPAAKPGEQRATPHAALAA